MYVRLVKEAGWDINRVPDNYRTQVELKLQGGN